MNYISTRSTGAAAQMGGFQDILLEGLAQDGGLAMPASIPQIDRTTLDAFSKQPYPALAAEIISRFATDIDRAVIDRLAAQAYTVEKFGSAEIAPLTPLGIEQGAPLAILELSNGPTLAFKDMAMQMLGQLFEYVLTQRGEKLNILGATSGDTGSAAEYAMRDKHAVSVFMLSPQGRMSAFQRAQMYSLQEPNIHNLAVAGVFDDCQDMVKAVSADLEFKAKWRIGTVNSINWARIMSQVVYYFKGYLAAVHVYGLKIGDPVSFSVPSGNFGNVFSGFIAKSMGLPIAKLVVATNENDVLDEFFRTGVYRVRGAKETYQTSSPSMDISKASNFERFIFAMTGNDGAATAALWRELAQTGQFKLSGTVSNTSPVSDTWRNVKSSGLVSGKSTHQNRLDTIRDMDARYRRVIDTHTADGVFVGRKYLEPGVPMICLETALPAKFEETILEALGRPAPRPSGLEHLESLPQRVENIGQDVAQLKHIIAERALR
ncbi:MAG: threonine synthase [Burkholderiaceae bacterium]|nr:threonine synthase [Burkholderiaceae bacterium]